MPMDSQATRSALSNQGLVSMNDQARRARAKANIDNDPRLTFAT
jgi:hypothetical protein